jgi:hypothetical protein
MFGVTRTRLVQLIHPEEGRRAGLVDDEELHLLATYRSIYDFALAAIETGWKLRELLSTDLSGIVLEYREVHALKTPWRLLPAFDHPSEPGRCLVCVLEVEGGQTVWRYQGSGDCLSGHGGPLTIPNPSSLFPEIAAAYVIGQNGVPRRLGLMAGIRGARECAVGPELVADADFHLEGSARLLRNTNQIWSCELSSGSASVTSALAAAEARHFERADHRRCGDTHVLFFGAKSLGAAGFPHLDDGDEAIVQLVEFGKPLQARAVVRQANSAPAAVVPL